MTAAVSISIGDVANAMDGGGYALLNTRATQAKQAGDLIAAVAFLQQAKATEGNHYKDTRLAKFLQEAGRTGEALAEIEWLIERSQLAVSDAFAGQPASVIQQQRVIWLLQIHRAAILICRRANLPERGKAFEMRHDAYLDLLERLETVAEQDAALHAEQRAQERIARRALWKSCTKGAS